MPEFHDCHIEGVLVGNSPAIRRICDQLQKAAQTEAPVLITGECGTGKGLVAKFLHDMSDRSAHRFLKLSCAAMSSQFFDREFEAEAHWRVDDSLFDPTETSADRIIGGTIFLDEIDELDLALQGKLLHKLQDSNLPGFSGLGDPNEHFRLICATNRDLEAAVASGSFRVDLYYRINVLRIHMPPLRECAEDVPQLMQHFINVYSKKFNRYPVPLSPGLIRALESYHWPGNTRELENMAKRYVVLNSEDHVLSMMQPSDAHTPVPVPVEEVDLTTPLRVQTKRAIQHLENKIILGVLKAHNWNRRKTARSLDISYRTLLYKIKEGGLPRSNT
jgi:two-component system, NtrC family, response regulator AtoC